MWRNTSGICVPSVLLVKALAIVGSRKINDFSSFFSSKWTAYIQVMYIAEVCFVRYLMKFCEGVCGGCSSPS